LRVTSVAGTSARRQQRRSVVNEASESRRMRNEFKMRVAVNGSTVTTARSSMEGGTMRVRSCRRRERVKRSTAAERREGTGRREEVANGVHGSPVAGANNARQAYRQAGQTRMNRNAGIVGAIITLL